MDKVKYFFQQSWLLIIASFFFGLLIAVANAAWQDNILRNEENKFNALVREMIPDVDSGKGKKKLTSVRKVLSAEGQRVGWAFMCEGSGFADKIRLVIAADSEFEKFFGFKVLSSYETPGFGSKIAEDDPESNEDLVDEFKDAPVGEFVLVKTGKRRENESQPNDNVIIAISGATVSSDAVVKIFNAYTDKVRDELQEKGLIGNGE
ncbi:MAG: FMN-binding protein [Planctomycetota bacterium]